MKCYLAGWQSETKIRSLRLAKAGVLGSRCFSFANVIDIPGLPWHLPGVEAGYRMAVAQKAAIMMDSGVYSLRTYRRYLEKHGKSTSSMPSDEEYVQLYVDFCKKHGHSWDFYVTVDFVKVCAPNYKQHLTLEKMGLRPAPVFHGDADLDFIRRYADRGYSYLCIGTAKWLRTGATTMRRYLDAVFNLGEKLKLEFHGLGMTSPWTMLGFPWRSVDSSSWARVAGFGSLLAWDERTQRLSTLHVSDRVATGAKLHTNARLLAGVREHVQAQGYDFDLLRTDGIYRTQYNAQTMLDLAKYAGTYQRVRWRHLV